MGGLGSLWNGEFYPCNRSLDPASGTLKVKGRKSVEMKILLKYFKRFL